MSALYKIAENWAGGEDFLWGNRGVTSDQEAKWKSKASVEDAPTGRGEHRTQKKRGEEKGPPQR